MITEPIKVVDQFLRGACVGRWDLFDSRHNGERASEFAGRSAAARDVCHGCPILEGCRELTRKWPAHFRRGVTLAGITYRANGTPLARASRSE